MDKTAFIDPLHPGRDRRRRQLECVSGFLQRPSSSGPQLQDRHPLGGWIMRSAKRCYLGHASIFDAQGFP